MSVLHGNPSSGLEPATRPAAPWLPTSDDLLEWLWRRRFSSDGSTATCRRCGRVRTHHRVRGRPAWQCDACGTHVHPTAGTLMQRTRLPLRTWLRAALALRAYPTISARQLQTELRVTYKTAWRLRRLIQPRLPSAPLTADELSKEDVLDLFEAVVCAQHATSARPAFAGRSARRDTRALRRRFALGSGRLMPREALEERILRAACAVLVRRGYGAARMADIAAEARVSLAAVYAHFKNREDLLLSAIDWANAEGTLARERIIAADWSATAKLGAFLDLAVPAGRVREEHALYMDLWSRVGGEARLRPMVVRARERWHRYFRAIVAEGIASGEFRPRTNLDDSVAVIVALQTGIGVEAVVQFAWMPDDRARALLASFVGNELGIEPSRLLAFPRRPTRERFDPRPPQA